MTVHFIHQIEHFDVELYSDSFSETGEVVEEITVFPLKIGGNDVALVLFCLGDDGGFSFQVADDTALLLAGTEPCREIDDDVV